MLRLKYSGVRNMNTLIINAAVKADGNSAFIADALAKKYDGCRMFNLAELRFETDYENKFRDGGSFRPEMVENGLRDVMSAVVDSDLIIFISPNYFGFISGLAKMFLDRFHVLLNKSGRPTFEGSKKFFFILTQGSPNRSHGQSTLDWMKGFCNIFNFKFYGIVVPSCSYSNTDAARVKMEEISMSLSMFI